MITYSVGDIHGCFSQLIDLIELCQEDAAGRPSRFIFLGDYIDRGANSRDVLDRLLALHKTRPDQFICLLGNHEDMLLAAFDDSLFEDRWLQNGGELTLESYGVTTVTDLPREHLDWLRALPKFYDDGRRFFVHAGVNPDRPLNAQNDFDLLWIRKPFLLSDKDFGRLVVHGHTPTSTRLPDIRPNRLNIDTGTVFGGPLTAAVFGDDAVSARRFLTSR